MNMKKIMCLLLALALCVTMFAACGNGGETSKVEESKTEETKTEETTEENAEA